MRLSITALALALALAGAAPRAALAATNPVAVNTDAQREQVADAVLEEWFAAVDFKGTLRDSVTGAFGKWYFVTLRPEWAAALNDAVREELDADGPTVRALLARQMAKAMTIEELQAGLVVIRDPAMAANLRATSKHAGPPPAPPALQLDAQRAATSPAGVSFARKMDHVDDIFAPAKADVVFAVMPGVLRRFGQKTGAVEARLRAAAKGDG